MRENTALIQTRLQASRLIYVCGFIVILFLCLIVNLAFSELLFFSIRFIAQKECCIWASIKGWWWGMKIQAVHEGFSHYCHELNEPGL